MTFTMKTKNFLAFFTFFGFTIAYIISANSAYNNLFFSSDGFHYFSAIRNFIDFFSFYEGPTFEYLLGNHSYLTLYITSPVFFFFKTPKTFIFINAFIVLITSYSLYKTSLILLKNNIKERYLLSFAAALSFLLNPMLGQYLTSVYLFQPDIYFPLFISLSIYYLIKNNTKGYLFFMILMLLCKEEALIVFPFFLFMLLFYLKEELEDKKKLIFLSVIIYFVVIGFSFYSLNLFSQYNNIHHARKVFNFEETVYSFIHTKHTPLKYIFITLLPLLFFILPIVKDILIKRRSSLFFITLIIIILLKGFINFVIYRNFDGSSWSNLWIIPIYLISAIKTFSQIKSLQKINYMVVTLYLLILFVCLFLNFQNFNDIRHRVTMREISDINSEINKKDKLNYIIVEEYTIPLFIKNQSHVSHNWLNSLRDHSLRKKIISDADYIIFKKNKEIDQEFLENHKIKNVSKNLILLEHE
jgi:hypothetical protein